MGSSLTPLSTADMRLMQTRQSLQKSVFWRDLAAAIRGDSRRLCSQAMQLRMWSRQVLAQKACLKSGNLAQSSTRELLG